METEISHFKFSEWRDSGNEIRLFIAIGEKMTLRMESYLSEVIWKLYKNLNDMNLQCCGLR